VKAKHTPQAKATKGQRAKRTLRTATLTPYALALVAKAKPRKAKALATLPTLPAICALPAWRVRARARMAKARAHFASNRALANRARKESARQAPAPFATTEAHDCARVAIGACPLERRLAGGFRWPVWQRVSRASVLLRGELVLWREGESAQSALARIIQAPARSYEESTEAPAPASQWLFSAHLSPREQRVFRALQTRRRKQWCALALARLCVARDAKAHALRWQRARVHRARAIKRQRKAWRKAGACAGQRARFHFIGATIIKGANGKRLGRKEAREAGATIPARDVDFREGCGVPLDYQAKEEMRLASHAEFLVGAPWKAGNRAAYLTISRALREPSFSTLGLPDGLDASELRARASDRHARRAGAAWQSEAGSGDANEAQPSCAEMLAESDDEARLSPLVLTLAKRKRARLALRAYFGAKKSNATRTEHAKALCQLRAMARQVISGERALVAFRVHRIASADEKAARAAYQKNERLSKRVIAGIDTLKAREAEKQEARQLTREAHGAKREACAPAPALPAPALIALPRGQAENAWRDRTPAQRALCERLLAKPSAKAKPLPNVTRFSIAPALATLAEWQPSAKAGA
jgi:hypothetical protein